MATSAGHGRPNEDFVGTAPGILVLLDGAGIVGTEAICHHGVAWYSHTLGAALLARMAHADGAALATTLAESIDLVAEQHRHTCDIANPSSPQSTVAMIRFAAGRADYLVLADTFVVLDPSGADPQVITDPREVNVRRECTAVLRGLPEGTLEYDRARASAINDLRSRRNQSGGYWIAKENPQAAAEAVTGSVSLEGLNGAALLSNGASRIVDPYRLTEWAAVLDLLRSGVPDEILRRIREAESTTGAADILPGFTSADDATVAYCNLTS
ncbi:MAG: protein phosphatase 2C domain-containing protein [Nocardioidaceae bacterium]